MGISIRSSYDSFRALRENGGYYIDKTKMLEEYLERRFDRAVLFARPRRFGKTLTMTMFRDFLDIRQKSGGIFEGLEIMEKAAFVEKYMNRFPVVFISLKECFGKNYEDFLANARLAVSEICKSFSELAESEKVNEDDKGILSALRRQTANEANTAAALGLLARMLFAHYGKPAFIFIDEYDVPMARAFGLTHYELVRDFVERMLSFVCKTNDNVKAVILSGCLFTVKNSTYTGVNNINAYTVLSPIYASSIGFTDTDVRRLLKDANLSDRYETVAEWYDGYLFGREKMYCPWDVLSYVKSVLEGSYSEAMGPESYWVNTSETSQALIRGFLGKSSEANESFERLLAGETIRCTVNENLSYHRIYESGENLWSALVETGYLTKAVPERMPRMPLRIPNRGIQNVFRQEVCGYFKKRLSNKYVKELEAALWAGERGRAEDSLNLILEATLSFYHEYHEYSYHLILDGLFTGLEYRVLSEMETGYGRSDLVVLDTVLKRGLLLELKRVTKESEMEAALREASSQILTRKYESQLKYSGYTGIRKYAMAFCGKKARIIEIFF